MPGRRGDHDVKFGTNFVYTPLHIYDASTLNGTFTFSSTDLDFNPANPRTYPDRLSIRVPGASDFIVDGNVRRRVRAGQMEGEQPRHGERRPSVRLGGIPLEEKDNPRFSSVDAYPVDKNNFSPRLGVTVVARRHGQSVMRGGWGLFYQKTPFTFVTGVVSAGVFRTRSRPICGP